MGRIIPRTFETRKPLLNKNIRIVQFIVHYKNISRITDGQLIYMSSAVPSELYHRWGFLVCLHAFRTHARQSVRLLVTRPTLWRAWLR